MLSSTKKTPPTSEGLSRFHLVFHIMRPLSTEKIAMGGPACLYSPGPGIQGRRRRHGLSEEVFDHRAHQTCATPAAETWQLAWQLGLVL